MVLNHLAAILFFAGPLFYGGLWMVIDPAVVARPLLKTFVHPDHADLSRVIRAGVRCAGAVLILVTIAL